MKKFICTMIPILLFLNLFPQGKKSLLYDEMGRLFIDSTLQINNEQLKKWINGENYFLSGLADNIKYSTMAREGGLQGLVIISFECDSSSIIKNFAVIKRVGGGLEQSVIEGIKKSEKEITRYLKNKSNFSEKYFLPFTFELKSFSKEVGEYKTIRIKDFTVPLIEKYFNCPTGKPIDK